MHLIPPMHPLTRPQVVIRSWPVER